jgi:serine protease Do
MASSSEAAAGNPLVAMSDALAAVVDRVGTSTLAVLGRRGAIASGVVWRAGVLVSAAHVFRRAPAAVAVLAADGNERDATLVGVDTSTDIAVFRLPEAPIASAEIGDPAQVRAGHLVIAIGRSGKGDVSASYGLVNRVSGPWQTWLGGQVDRLIRLDGGLYDGLSGGPVADAGGMVIGVATSALSRSHGIVVPASTVSRVVDTLLAKGHVSRAYLGIAAQPVPLPKTGDAASPDAAQRSGLLITALAPDGPAEKAGLLIGDIVVDAAGRPASDLHELRASLADHIGERVRVSVLRGGAPAEVTLTVGEWPSQRRSC